MKRRTRAFDDSELPSTGKRARLPSERARSEPPPTTDIPLDNADLWPTAGDMKREDYLRLFGELCPGTHPKLWFGTHGTLEEGVAHFAHELADPQEDVREEIKDGVPVSAALEEDDKFWHIFDDLVASPALKSLLEGERRIRTPPKGMYIANFPHILDDVIRHATPRSVRALRKTSRWMKERVDLEQRHYRLQAFDFGRYDRVVSLDDVWPSCTPDLRSPEALAELGRHAKKYCMPPTPIWSYSRASGMRQHTLPRDLDVLDVDRGSSRLWYEYATLQRPDIFRALRHEWARRANDRVGDWLQDATQWYSVQPRLVRYTGGTGPMDILHGNSPLKQDPCAVHFCDAQTFVIRLSQLQELNRRHYDCYAPLTTVFNATIKACIDIDLLRLLGFLGTTSCIHMSEGEIVLFLKLEPSYAATLHEEPPVFWLHFLYILYDPIQEKQPHHGTRRKAKGSITIVGHEALPADLLPHPLRTEGDEDTPWEGMDSVPEDLKDELEHWDNEHSFEARLQWWVKYWAAVAGSRESTDRETRYPICEPKPVRLLTTTEWKAEIGDTYFELMTDPKAKYRSRKPLPPFNDLVAQYQQNRVQKYKEFALRMKSPEYKQWRTESKDFARIPQDRLDKLISRVEPTWSTAQTS